MKSVPNMPTCDKCMMHFRTVFKDLTSEEMQQVTYEKICQSLKKGTVMYHEGNRMSGFYCIHKGIIKIFKTGSEGKEQIIRFARQGDIIGYRSVLSGELACTSARVLEDAEVCFIPASSLQNLIRSNPVFSFDLLQLVCKELGEANSFITDIAQKTVRERLAEVLLLLKNSFGLDNDQVLKISLTREELANIIGTATESVIRLLSEFKSDKLIEIQGRKIKILDEPKLMKIGNIFD
ncbi:MAG: Crp/Fnr family transcriptional regulator [Bacteroidota bacterium]